MPYLLEKHGIVHTAQYKYDIMSILIVIAPYVAI